MLLSRYVISGIVTLFAMYSLSAAQTPPPQTGGLAAQSRDVRTALILPGTASTLLPFVVDPSGQGGDLFHIISSEPGAIVTLILPNGTEVNSGNAAALGYQFVVSDEDNQLIAELSKVNDDEFAGTWRSPISGRWKGSKSEFAGTLKMKRKK